MNLQELVAKLESVPSSRGCAALEVYFGEDYDSFDYPKFDAHITTKEIVSWSIDHYWTGMQAIYLDDKLVAITWHPYPKSDTDVYFTNLESYKNVKSFVLSCHIEKEDDPPIINMAEIISITQRVKDYPEDFPLLRNNLEDKKHG